MKLLLDENLPNRLKADFQEHEVYTVHEQGWRGVKDGVLLQLMIKNGFDALLTFDKSLQYQQNFQKYTVTVFILLVSINTYPELTKVSSKVLDYLNITPLPVGPIIISPNKDGLPLYQ